MAKKSYIVRVEDSSDSAKIVTVEANTETEASVEAAKKVNNTDMKVTSIKQRDGDV